MNQTTEGGQPGGWSKAQPTVRVVLAAQVSEELREALAERVRRMAGEAVQISWETDPYLYGGVVIHLPDRVLDFSLAQQFRTYGRTVQQAIGHELGELSVKAHSAWPVTPGVTTPAARG